MEYIHMVVGYKIIHDFDGVCLAVKTDKQVFVTCVFIGRLIHKAVVYGGVERFVYVAFARPVVECGGVKIYIKVHVATIAYSEEIGNVKKPFQKAIKSGILNIEEHIWQTHKHYQITPEGSLLRTFGRR